MCFHQSREVRPLLPEERTCGGGTVVWLIQVPIGSMYAIYGNIDHQYTWILWGMDWYLETLA